MHNNRSQNELQSRNLKSLVFMAAVALVFSCLSVRLLYLQYVQYEKNLQSSEENRLRRIVLKAERGLIYDRNGTLLVGNRPSYQIVIKPAEIRKMKPEAKAELFNRLIHMKDSQGEAILIPRLWIRCSSVLRGKGMERFAFWKTLRKNRFPLCGNARLNFPV